MPPSQSIDDAELPKNKVRSEDPNFDDPPALTWTCVMGNEKFLGESRKAMAVEYDIWYSELGERRHTQYKGPNSQTNMSYETDSDGWNKSVSQRAILQPNTEYKVFPGTYDGKIGEYSYGRQGGREELSIDLGDKSVALQPGTKEYKDGIEQMKRVNFDPPCPKPLN